MELLIVDDEYYAVEGLKKLINRINSPVQNVFCAYNLRDAKQIFLQNNIDVMLCDIEMEEENGIDLLRWVNDYSPDTKTIFLSCHDRFCYVQQALQLGAVNYILKPVDEEELTRLLDSAHQMILEQNRRFCDLKLAELMKKYVPIHQKREPGMSNLLREVDTFIVDHIDECISRKDVADHVFLNADYMNRVIKKETGLSVGEYIVQKKLSVAKFLLLETDIPVGDIVFRVGYTNVAYFNKSFKKETGLTPREFRRKHNAEETLCRRE